MKIQSISCLQPCRKRESNQFLICNRVANVIFLEIVFRANRRNECRIRKSFHVHAEIEQVDYAQYASNVTAHFDKDFVKDIEFFDSVHFRLSQNKSR